ncbi:nuclear pore complex protein Nup50 [Pseudomyrmex gracilis]|uniref:nuclear pore complex protein Nup50 n=1 Tax=Pseudomyrmex gracilis TaxID=219809 RepID=UPI0009950A8C|nr:nuclear pore complex protein Nup50 [Pseudomyrmex gracilis]XP_020285571.1 nuclear pore complex protein Nup50 [Pseudomyrmex gracilis]XP_020285572.1 nuclear pore complex protein Nup50 [Pseudomyrmex gracilis]
MSAKRSATTDLNHDNWNEEHEPEEVGTFVKASNDVLEKRVFKTARRRLPQSNDEGATKSAFGTFTGFKTTPVTNTSPFSFLANTSTSTSTSALMTSSYTGSKNIATNGASKISKTDKDKDDDIVDVEVISSTSTSKKPPTKEEENEKTKTHSSSYYAKLKGLNESVASWIKVHVDKNPYCILTPIFRDYEKYLKEITSKEESAKPQTPHASELAAQTATNDDKKDTNKNKPDSSPFGNSLANIKTAVSTPAADFKPPEKSIFSNVASTKSIFGNSEQQKFVFGSSTDNTTEKNKSIFGNTESNVASKNIFGNANVESNPFLNKPSVSEDKKPDEEEGKPKTKPVAPTFPISTFSFGQSSTNNVTAGFSFGGAKPFTFAPQSVKSEVQDSEDKGESENKDDDDEEPPKPDFKPVTEEGAIYEQRCKVFVKKDGNYSDRGVGMLYLKPTPNGKMQLIVRADTSLGNLLLNTLLTSSIPTKLMNKNTIMLVCLPLPDSTPPPVPVLLRVKTSEAADELLETLNKHKK